MEKYCKSCGRVFKDSDFKLCPYCGNQLSTRTGRQPIPRQLRHQVFQRDGYRCRECGATNKETRLHVDHIKPVAKGGTNDLNNLQTLCEDCNRAKYTDEWVGGFIDDKYGRLNHDFKDSELLALSEINISKTKSAKEISKRIIDGTFILPHDDGNIIPWSFENGFATCEICGTSINPDEKYCEDCKPPLVTIPIMPSIKKEVKYCPNCNNKIDIKANKCRYCNHIFE